MATTSTNYHSTSNTADLTITIAGLATSGTLVTGRQSTIVDNTSNLYVDALVTGQITTGTATAGSILVYVYTPIDLNTSTFVYPTATATALTESDGSATFEADQLAQLRLGAAINANATDNRAYSFVFGLAALFGGLVPLKWGIFLTHNTVGALHATAGNHWITYTGYKFDTV